MPIATIDLISELRDKLDHLFVIEKVNKRETIIVDSLLYIKSGRFSVVKISNDLVIENLTAPYFIGMSVVYGEYLPLCIIALEDLELCRLPSAKTMNVINSLGLHQIYVKLIMRSVFSLYHHDDIVSAENSYDVIKKILEAYIHRPFIARKNIAATIVSLTGLSRSNVMSILRELKKGNFITIDKGCLISINKLPEYY